MTKKFLSTVAAAAVMATGAMAFDAINGQGLNYKWDANSTTASGNFTLAQAKQRGDALIFPAYFVGNGWETTIRVINTSSTNAVVAKVVLFAGNDSHEVRDFNIYLSANDVWRGTIKIDSDGVARLISTDDSSPLPGIDGKMASVDNPMKSEAIDVKSGYIEVIGCAAATSPADRDHKNLRAAYQIVAKHARGINGPIVFQNGVITSNASVPGVKYNSTELNATLSNGKTYVFQDAPNVLTGDVRITDTVNGKDMVMPAIKLRNVTEQNKTLLFVEGEAANIADRALINKNNNNIDYNATLLRADAAQFNTTDVWMTYGDSSSLVNNQLILTSPYKRLLVNADANIIGSTVTSNGNISKKPGSTTIAGLYNGVKAAKGKITDYGYFTGLALIYDESENQAKNSQFSPANTPTLNFKYEVSATEGNPVQTDNLSYYLNAARANGSFSKGFARIQFRVNGVAKAVPTIPTQMIATEAAGRVITNWIVPETK